MVKPSKRVEVNNFVKGLITEASPLNFPDNASLDEENFELNRDGTRDRRLGFGMEPGFDFISLGISDIDIVDAVTSTFKWKNVAGSPDNEFLVVQVNRKLFFFDLNTETLSVEGYLGSLDVSNFPNKQLFSFASLEGQLVVVGNWEQIGIISYTSGSFSITYESLKVRDVWGVQVTSTPAYENDPLYRGAFDALHSYNLRNQSWGIPRKNTSGVVVDPATEYFSYNGKYPSNSEVVWTGVQFQPVTSGVSTESIYPNLFEESIGSDVKAPKGYFIIDALKRGTSRYNEAVANVARYPQLYSGVAIPPPDLTVNGPKCVIDFAGRVFYSGFDGLVTSADARSPNFSNFILFSQLVRNRKDFTKCYQEGDPTSRENSEVVETDGGFIRVSGANTIIGLVNLSSHIIVIADNGVWTITGGNDYGFSATNYKVTKISSFGTISASSIVVEGGRAFYWSDDGIYVIAKNKVGEFEVNNITSSTIQTLYENIDNVSKISVKSEYDPVNRKLRWLYKTNNPFTFISQTEELVFDTLLNAFYRNKIKNLQPNIVEVFNLFTSTPFRRGGGFSAVYSGTDLVYSTTDVVGITETIRNSGIQSMRYVVIKVVGGTSYLSFGYYNNTEFYDWQDIDLVGVDAKGYLLTGQVTAGDGAVAKQTPYIVTYMRRTEDGVLPNFTPSNPSGCLMRTQWDFSNTINSNKWSQFQQVYRYRRPLLITNIGDNYDNGFELVVTKSKMRGRGRSFAVYFETEAGKDCRIVGWNITLNGNTTT